LTWTKGTGANNTYIERNTSGVTSWDRGEGTEIYNDTGTNYEDTGLEPGVTYYYQAWSYTTWDSLEQWSDLNASVNNETVILPTVVTNASTGVEETNATLHGYLQNDGGEDCTVRFEWGQTTSYGNATENQTKTSGESFSDYVDTSTFRPNEAGDVTQLTIRGGLDYNWDCVDDVTPDDNTAYVSRNGGSGDYRYDLYNIPNHTAVSGSINQIKIFFRCKSSITSPLNAYPKIKINGTEYNGDVESIPYSPWTTRNYTWTTNPDVGEAWTWDDIDELQIGIALWKTSGGFACHCTQVYIEVDYDAFSPGTLYHYRAVANNSVGTSYGSDEAFLTKPEVPAAFTATMHNKTQINLTWTKGTGANNTYIERNTSGVTSWDRGEGIVVYNDTGTNYEDIDLTPGPTYYYQAWSYTNWTYNSTVFQQYSDTYAEANATTNNLPEISNPYPSNGSTNISVNPTLNITVNDADGDSMNITWYSNSSGSWQIFGTNTTCSNGTYYMPNNNFSNYSITYYWNVSVNDGTTTNNSPIYYFTTEPINTSVDTISPYQQTTTPLNLTAAGQSTLDNVTLWYRYSTDNNSWGDNWWNSDWNYKRGYNVNNSITNYTININVTKDGGNTVDCNGHCNDNFSDIRFVDDSNNELNYWIESQSDGNYANLWLNISDATTIFMYYNNTGASSTSEINGTFLTAFDSSWDYSDDAWWEYYYERDSDSHYKLWVWNLSEPVDVTNDVGYQMHTYSKLHAIQSRNWAGGINVGCSNDNNVTTDYTNTIFNDDYARWFYTFNTDDAADDNSPGIKVYLGNEESSASTSDWNAQSFAEGGYYYQHVYYEPWNDKITWQVNDSNNGSLDSRTLTDADNNPDENLINFFIYLTGDSMCGESYHLCELDDDHMRVYKKGSHYACGDNYLDQYFYWFTLSMYAETEPSLSSSGNEQTPDWMLAGGTNPDTNHTSGGWNWTFNYPNGTGYYEFYSIGKKNGSTDETAP
ncbi:protein of unknown function (DUF2341), partial [Thermoplasmatales archaeon SCGC AB-539-N05]